MMTKENNGWISVKNEPLPKNSYFMAYTKTGDVEILWRAGQECVVRHNLFLAVDVKDITHWQPLPSPPITND